MTPDYEKAAIKATETLISNNIGTAPVDPIPILKKIPNVLVMSYESISKELNEDRRCVMDVFGVKNQDAFTTVFINDDQKHYLVTFNQLLSVNLVQRALARELGHIILEHDGTRPESVRNEEAICFAHHLLCPRPLLHSITVTGLCLTTEMLGNITGCYDYCLACIRRQPGVKVPAEMNRKVRDQFMPYILNYFAFQRYAALKDPSADADLGSYMEGYEE